MNKTDSAKNMLIDTIDSLVREKYGDSYGDGEPFSRLCPAIYELDRKDLQRISNLLCKKPYAETAEIGKMEILSLMCAVEATAGMSKDKAIAQIVFDLANGTKKSTGLIEKVKESYREILSPKKTHDEPDKNIDGAGKNNPSPKGREKPEKSVQPKHRNGRNLEKPGRNIEYLGR